MRINQAKPRKVLTRVGTTTGVKKINKALTRIGVLGGAFNPPHLAHLVLAKKALKIAGFKKIIFMPCGLPALKKTDLARAEDRLAMIKILIKNNLYPVKSREAGATKSLFDRARFEISDYEIKKGEKGKKSYTLETIRYLKRKYPGYQIYWILGEDSFREMVEGKWKYDGLKMLNEAQFIVASRKAHPFSLKFLPKKFEEKSKKYLKKVIKLNINIPVSATRIREEIKKGEKRNKSLPLEIFNYIKKNKLYSRISPSLPSSAQKK